MTKLVVITILFTSLCIVSTLSPQWCPPGMVSYNNLPCSYGTTTTQRIPLPDMPRACFCNTGCRVSIMTNPYDSLHPTCDKACLAFKGWALGHANIRPDEKNYCSYTCYCNGKMRTKWPQLGIQACQVVANADFKNNSQEACQEACSPYNGWNNDWSVVKDDETITCPELFK
jgi:hypothetical protein